MTKIHSCLEVGITPCRYGICVLSGRCDGSTALTSRWCCWHPQWHYSYRVISQQQSAADMGLGTGKLIKDIPWNAGASSGSSCQLYAASFPTKSHWRWWCWGERAKIFDRTAGDALVGTVAGLSRGVYSLDFNVMAQSLSLLAEIARCAFSQLRRGKRIDAATQNIRDQSPKFYSHFVGYFFLGKHLFDDHILIHIWWSNTCMTHALLFCLTNKVHYTTTTVNLFKTEMCDKVIWTGVLAWYAFSLTNVTILYQFVI